MAAPCVFGIRNRNNCECAPCRDWQIETSYGKRQAGSQWATQSRDASATVRVSGGYNRRSHGNFDADAQRTDVEIFDKTGSGGVEKTHLSIDTDGNRTVWKGNESFGS